MTPQTIETELAYALLCLAAERIDDHINWEDWDAAIVASLVTAIEIATARKLKPIHELFKEKE